MFNSSCEFTGLSTRFGDFGDDLGDRGDDFPCFFF
eukprot:g13491.t1